MKAQIKPCKNLKKTNKYFFKGYPSQTKNVCKWTLIPAKATANPVKNFARYLLENLESLNTEPAKSKIEHITQLNTIFKLNVYRNNSKIKLKKI